MLFMQPSPLRLLITTPNLDTAGSKYVIADIVQGLDRAIVKPSICVHRKTNSSLERSIKNSVEEFYEIPLRVPTRPRRRFLQTLINTLQVFPRSYDLIHSFDYSSSWTEGLIARLIGKPWIVEKTNMNWGGLHWNIRSLLANHIICYSHRQYDTLFRSSRFSKKVSTIHIGVNLARFQRTAEGSVIREELGLPPNATIVGCVAHLVPVKGHVELLQAFTKVSKDFPKANLVLVGEGERDYRSQLMCLTNELTISDRVFFLGLRNDVPRIMSAFDGLILATRDWGRKEAFGAVLVEAMACGLPVIATKSGGPQDIVVHGETGWLVEPHGSEPLETALRELLFDDHRRSQFGIAARARAEKYFSDKLMVHQYQELYRRIGRGHQHVR